MRCNDRSRRRINRGRDDQGNEVEGPDMPAVQKARAVDESALTEIRVAPNKSGHSHFPHGFRANTFR
jgi:hypothetical protein